MLELLKTEAIKFVTDPGFIVLMVAYTMISLMLWRVLYLRKRNAGDADAADTDTAGE